MPPSSLYHLVLQRLGLDADLFILFCFDPNQRYLGSLGDWPADALVEKIDLDTANLLELKFRLSLEIPTKPILVYSNQPKPKGEAFQRWPLIDSYYAGVELVIDEEALFLETFGLNRTLHLDLVQQYRNILDPAGKHIDFLQPVLNPSGFNLSGICRALLGLAIRESQGLKVLPGWEILLGHFLVAIANGSLTPEEINKCLSTEELRKELNKEIRYYLSVEVNLDEISAQNLRLWVRQIKYLALKPQMVVEKDPYQKRLFGKGTLPPTGLLLHTISTWQNHSELKEKQIPVWQEFAGDIKESELVKSYGVETTYPILTSGLASEILLELAGLAAKPEANAPYIQARNAEVILQKQGPSLREVLQNEARSIGRFVGSATHTLSTIPSEAELTLNTPAAYIESYANRWYLIDQHYRKACHAFQELSLHSEMDSRIISLNKKLQNAYLGFERGLNKAWLEVVKESGWVWPTSSVLTNTGFFEYTEKNMKAKTVIIISDGFRFEIARQLETALNKDSLYEPDLQPMLALPPTRTSVGMARLLPQGKRVSTSVDSEDKLVSTIDKKSTEGLESRLAFIAAHKPESNYFAIQASELIEARSEKVREWFRNHSILYVYHDVIDKVADKKASETSLPQLCEDAVKELEALCKKLTTGNFNRIVITADHGFLYQHEDPDASERVPMPELKDVAEAGYRYILAPAQESPAHILSFPSGIENGKGEPLDMFVPVDSRRFKRKGSGMRYAHGGVSLQEMVTPYLAVYRRETAAKDKVAVRLQPPQSIRSNTFKIRVDQLSAVDAQHKSRKVMVAVFRSDGITSAAMPKEIHMDVTSALASQRSKEVTFTLFALPEDTSELIIGLYDTDDKNLPLEEIRVPTSISITPDF